MPNKGNPYRTDDMDEPCCNSFVVMVNLHDIKRDKAADVADAIIALIDNLAPKSFAGVTLAHIKAQSTN